MWLEQVCPQLNNLWRGEWSRGYVEPARYLYDHELVCVGHGSVRMTVEASEWNLEAGDFIVIPPNKQHRTVATTRRVQRSCMHFDWDFNSRGQRPGVWSFHPRKPLREETSRTPAFVPEGILTGRFELEGAIPGLLESLFHRWQIEDVEARAFCRGIFLEILTRLFWPQSTQSPAPDNRRAQLAYAVKDLLDRRRENSRNDEGIRELLETLGFSYAHLCRMFHQTFGLTPVLYLNACKLERARQLLQDPKISIAEVAYASGFQDAAYFCRKFREQNGVSPGSYRNQL